MDTSFSNTRESIKTARQCATDWANLTRAQQIQSIELDGFVVIPDLLSADHLEMIRDEMSRVPTTAVDYSEHNHGNRDLIATDSPNTLEVIANPEILEFLSDLYGDRLICTSVGYSASDPGHPGIVLHTDSQPYGSGIFGVQASSPVLARVLYYLDDQTPECSPFKVIPRSHLSMNHDGHPYQRYLNHPDEVMVTCKAGSAAIINQKVFHGNYPNYSDRTRRMLAIAYRPAWAGPIAEVEDRDPELIARQPEHISKLLGSLNTRDIEFDLPNRPDNMRTTGPGVSPERWS